MALMSYNKFANTNKYPGVRIYISENNDMIFYVRLDGKDIKVKVNRYNLRTCGCHRKSHTKKT